MVNERYAYQVVEVKPGLWGFKPQKLQEELNRLGAQGWELVTVQQVHGLAMRWFLKRVL